MKLTGVGASAGRSCARVYLFASDPSAADLESLPPHDPPLGHELLNRALTRTRVALIEVETRTSERLGAEHAAIFQAHRLIIEDEEWLEPIRARIEGGQHAAVAVLSVSEELAAELAAIDDEYLRARAIDILDVGKRVLAHLGVRVRPRLPGPDDGEVILVAHELTPSDTVDLDPKLVRGLATEIGTRTSHAAILARQLGIPAVVAVPGLLHAVRHAKTIAIDGDTGHCELDPPPATRATYRAPARVPIVTERVTTLDGIQVTVAANAASTQEVRDAVAAGADAIGLYRTEFLFLRAGETLPSEDAQAQEYCAAAEAAAGRPIVFRTLDIGADKKVPGITLPPEENPFLGVRGIRFSLQERALFETQLRALARASQQHPNVRVMLPMVSGPDELTATLQVAAAAGAADALYLGAMVEVPSAAVLVREMSPLVRFFSVGTNDLTAYVLAADRTNMRLGALYDELHPAILRFLSMIHEAAVDSDIPVSICGDVAGESVAAPVLIGLGYRSLSVAAPLVPRIKAAVRTVNACAARDLAARVLACRDAGEARSLLASKPVTAGVS